MAICEDAIRAQLLDNLPSDIAYALKVSRLSILAHRYGTHQHWSSPPEIALKLSDR